MACTLKRIATALAIVSVISFAIAALFLDGAVMSSVARRGLQVRPAIRALGDLPSATTVPLVFKATNGSSRPIRVVGVNSLCSSWGCINAENLPGVVPPHASSDVVLSLRTTARNFVGCLVFDAEVELYSDCPSSKVIRLHLDGRVVRADAED
jgi:hypothetical protein